MNPAEFAAAEMCDADRAARFESAYVGTPPWDIGRPQPAFVNLEQAGAIGQRVLDVGCGTGENALYLAERGHAVWGIDAAPSAIARAQAKAAARGLDVTFRQEDALALDRLGRTFETVIDSGLFHVFSDAERLRFVASLEAVLPIGGMYYLLCFSDRVPGTEGPRRVSEAEIRTTFANGWSIDRIEPARFLVSFRPDGVPAWLASIRRTPSS